MSGTPAIDTRSQNNCIKQKQSKKTKTKGKANKKAKKCSCAHLPFFFHVFFALFSHFFVFFLGGYSKNIFVAFVLHFFRFIFVFFLFFFVFFFLFYFCFVSFRFLFCFVFVFCFVFALFFAFSVAFILFLFTFFSQTTLFDGWPCMAAIAQHNSRKFHVRACVRTKPSGYKRILTEDCGHASHSDKVVVASPSSNN